MMTRLFAVAAIAFIQIALPVVAEPEDETAKEAADCVLSVEIRRFVENRTASFRLFDQRPKAVRKTKFIVSRIGQAAEISSNEVLRPFVTDFKIVDGEVQPIIEQMGDAETAELIVRSIHDDRAMLDLSLTKSAVKSVAVVDHSEIDGQAELKTQSPVSMTSIVRVVRLVPLNKWTTIDVEEDGKPLQLHVIVKGARTVSHTVEQDGLRDSKRPSI